MKLCSIWPTGNASVGDISQMLPVPSTDPNLCSYNSGFLVSCLCKPWAPVSSQQSALSSSGTIPTRRVDFSSLRHY